MAVKTFYENPEIKVVLLDKTLSGDVAHLVWSVSVNIRYRYLYLAGNKNRIW